MSLKLNMWAMSKTHFYLHSLELLCLVLKAPQLLLQGCTLLPQHRLHPPCLLLFNMKFLQQKHKTTFKHRGSNIVSLSKNSNLMYILWLKVYSVKLLTWLSCFTLSLAMEASSCRVDKSLSRSRATGSGRAVDWWSKRPHSKHRTDMVN